MPTIKYHFKGNDPFSSHSKIANMISEKGYQRILDVGCNKGFIGKALRKKSWKGFIVGLDKDKTFQEVKNSSGYNQFLFQDIEKKSNMLKKFDAIIFADVLEHLIDPLSVLLENKKRLNTNGGIIISLPNIANVYIRLKLLMGKFNYSNNGILDKDHKLFYTRSTAINLIKKSGLSILQHEITPIPLPLVYKDFSFGQKLYPLYYLFNLLSNIRSDFFAYQHIFLCRNKYK